MLDDGQISCLLSEWEINVIVNSSTYSYTSVLSLKTIELRENSKKEAPKISLYSICKPSWKRCLKINKSVCSAAYLSFNSIRFCYLILPLPPHPPAGHPASSRPSALPSSGFLCLQRISFKYFAFALIWFWAAASCAIATARLSTVIANLKCSPVLSCKYWFRSELNS